jgi:aldehyde oxidoreductase
LAEKLNIDPLQFRMLNALDESDVTVTGQHLGASTGIRQCLEVLRSPWDEAQARAAAVNAASNGRLRYGAGIAAAWYGCGNTSLPNPSTIRLGLKSNGRFALHQGAVDIGQGSNTVITQICAQTLRVPMSLIDLVSADTDLTPDAGKTSASRQTFVTGNAAGCAATKLRSCLLAMFKACSCAEIDFDNNHIRVSDGGKTAEIDLTRLPLNAMGYVAMVEATFDPGITSLDEKGQGSPYALYGFGAHIAEVSVDVELGLVRVLRVTAAHDTGRTINPTLAEGQIEGGIAQGIGFALLEEFFPGRGENLHDYLIPTIGDVPPIQSILVEVPAAVGPFGAKGLGEHTLIPTAPAILNAIYAAVRIRVDRLPATPDRILAALQASKHEQRP